MSMGKPVGIDLGTTNSAAAWVDESGHTLMLRNIEGDLITPSVVFFDDAEVVVGKEAKRAAAAYPDRVAQWVKRDMGCPVYSHPIRGEYLPPEVIQACVLRKFRADILASLGPAAKAVLTVPAYFDELRRKATADAGEMAGLSLLDIVNEPTAAALGFGETLGYLSPGGKVRDEMTVMVYDLGGGTFDATLLRLSPGDFCTLATDGDVQLGGHDWDGRLVDHAAESFQKLAGHDPRQDAAALARLYDAAVEAKHTLSARLQATIRVDCGGRSADVSVTRPQFEDMTADLLERTAYTSRQLLAAAGLEWKDVSRILLVGGSTRMPMVPRMLERMTGIIPDRTVNPDEAVARGAALYAHYLLSQPEHGGTGAAFEVTNVNAHSLGVEGIDPLTLRKINVVLIPRNSPLPARRMERFTTKSEAQRSIVIQVLQGESTLPGECTAIGRTVIRELPAGLPKGWPIDVTFEYGANGRLCVRAVVPGTQREVTLDLERNAGLSREGLSRWKRTVSGPAAVGFDQFEAMIQEVLHLAGPEGDNLPALVRGGSPVEEATDWELGATPIKSAPSPITSPPPSPITSPPPGFLSQPMPLSFQETSAPDAPSEPPAAGPIEAPPVVFRPAGKQRAGGSGGEVSSQGARWLIGAVAYVVSAVAGLALGYLLIRWWLPEASLPGLP